MTHRDPDLSQCSHIYKPSVFTTELSRDLGLSAQTRNLKFEAVFSTSLTNWFLEVKEAQAFKLHAYVITYINHVILFWLLNAGNTESLTQSFSGGLIRRPSACTNHPPISNGEGTSMRGHPLFKGICLSSVWISIEQPAMVSGIVYVFLGFAVVIGRCAVEFTNYEGGTGI